MRKVCRLAREVLDIAAAAAVPGVTTDYIDEIVHNACLERNVGIPSTADSQILIATVVSLAIELRPFPEVGLHIRQRSYLPRHSRSASTCGWRYLEH